MYKPINNIMTKLTIEQITELQKQYNVTKTQELINSGDIWKFEGSMGRFAMECLEAGVCFLPDRNTYDYYGNMIPARGFLEAGTKGSLENSQNFWSGVDQGDFNSEEYLMEMFGGSEIEN